MGKPDPGKLSAALEVHGTHVAGVPTAKTLAHLMRFAQWALDDAAHNLPPGRVSPEGLEELGRALIRLGGLTLDRAQAMTEDERS